MKYKLLLVDDEQFMLESMAKTIDWASLGYEICAKLSDGAKAMEYLRKNSVDVVFTDIKMPGADGLELARYINENYPGIKTVLISGHQEFEFARKAIEFNVVHYLLKPTRYSEIIKIFTDIKKQLDDKKDDNDELLPILARQFFFELYTGAIQDEQRIIRYFELMDIPAAFIDNPGCIAELTIEHYEEYMRDTWKHGIDGLTRAISQVLSGNAEKMPVFLFRNINSKIQATVICTKSLTMEQFKEDVGEYLAAKTIELKDTIGADCRIDNLFMFPSIMCFSKAGDYYAANNPVFNSQGQTVQADYENLLIYYINSGDVEAVNNLFNNYYVSFANQDISFLKSFNKNLLNRLSDVHENVSGDEFEDCTTIETLRRTGMNIFTGIAKNNLRNEFPTEKQLIYKAKQFINEHCCEDISLETVAGSIFVSPVYISRMFKERTGQNFIDYLTEMRMQKAAKLLEDPKLKVYEVSETVGYKSLKYFYKLFKQYLGLTPTEYRNKMKK